MSEHLHEDDLEERDDVVENRDDEKKPDPGEPWAKFSTGRDLTQTRTATSAPSSNAAELLGCEHQARGHTGARQGWTALASERVDSGAA